MYMFISILLMFLASFLPRMIPITLINKRIQSNFIRSFLFYVPYAVIASLTFPYIFYISTNIYISLIGTGVAILLSFLNQKMVIVAMGSVLVVYILLLIF